MMEYILRKALLSLSAYRRIVEIKPVPTYATAIRTVSKVVISNGFKFVFIIHKNIIMSIIILLLLLHETRRGIIPKY